MHSNNRRIPRMENVECILHLMSSLDDPVDVVRAAAVSHHWHRLVIEHGLCKRLFMERFPRVTDVAYKGHGRYHIIKLADVLIGDDLERERIIYSYLLQPQSKQMDCPRDCLLFPVGATSVAEIVLTTTTPVCRYPVGYSFLASEGQSGITEARLDFQQCLSIMSFLDDPADVVRASAVSRFWRQFVIGNGLAKNSCLKVLPQLSTIASVVIGSPLTSSSAEAETSTEFFERDHTVYASLLHAITKSKKNVLQPFKLPEPALCLGGYVQVELLGRVQRQESDGMNHVRAVGRPLYPAFDAEIQEPSGETWLRYCPEFLGSIMQWTCRNEQQREMLGIRMV